MISLEIKSRDEHIHSTTEAVYLKTCNRTEVYSGDGEIPVDIIRHLFRVTTGLESNLIGEKAIQGQVREAYKLGSKKPLSSSLHKLFQRALYVGKRVRTETGINRGAVSHSQAAVDLLINLDLDLKGSHITLIGAHNMNEKIMLYLKRKGAETIFLGNRTFDKAKDLADKQGSKAFHMDSLEEVLKNTDILITATSAPHHIIHKKNFPLTKDMTIIDLAVPEDVDRDVKELKNVHYIDNRKVEKSVNQNLAQREDEIKKATEIVEDEITLFLDKLKSDKERLKNGKN